MVYDGGGGLGPTPFRGALPSRDADENTAPQPPTCRSVSRTLSPVPLSTAQLASRHRGVVCVPATGSDLQVPCPTTQRAGYGMHAQCDSELRRALDTQGGAQGTPQALGGNWCETSEHSAAEYRPRSQLRDLTKPSSQPALTRHSGRMRRHEDHVLMPSMPRSEQHALHLHAVLHTMRQGAALALTTRGHRRAPNLVTKLRTVGASLWDPRPPVCRCAGGASWSGTSSGTHDALNTTLRTRTACVLRTHTF